MKTCCKIPVLKSYSSAYRSCFSGDSTYGACETCGFYSNVNPNVDHRRWSQATERRIGDFMRRETLMFNGYEEEVSHLYRGMDLKKYY